MTFSESILRPIFDACRPIGMSPVHVVLRRGAIRPDDPFRIAVSHGFGYELVHDGPDEPEWYYSPEDLTGLIPEQCQRVPGNGRGFVCADYLDSVIKFTFTKTSHLPRSETYGPASQEESGWAYACRAWRVMEHVTRFDLLDLLSRSQPRGADKERSATRKF